jgi:hypothetical protein
MKGDYNDKNEKGTIVLEPKCIDSLIKFLQRYKSELQIAKPDEIEVKIINVCKNYEVGDKLEEIKKVIGECCGYDYTQCDLSSVFYFLKDIHNKYVDDSYKNNIFDSLFRFKNSINLEDVIRRMISNIAMIRVMKDGKLLIDLNENEEE